MATNERSLILGFCNDGPYKHAATILANQSVKWLPWSYHIGSIDATVARDLTSGASLAGRRVLFACWDSHFIGSTTAIRCGRIDHFIYASQVLRVTVFLEDCTELEKKRQIDVKEPIVLCRYE